ncbi:MAG: galactose-1-phosphate uridylyltransferase [Nocardioidaceae bacterium]
MTVIRTPATDLLADGRTIRYYGTPPSTLASDSRALAPQQISSSLRYDPLHDEWVTIASHRQTRTHLPDRRDCPLCPSTPGHPTEIPASEYDVVVFDNRFPSFGASSGGSCEVVCFTPDHTQRFADLSHDKARLVIEAWADRTRQLGGRPDVAQVFIFENRGEEIGVTLHHPHGQIYALPFVAPRTTRMLEITDRRPETVTKMLQHEITGPRVVIGTEHWVAFVPEFARWPVELHLYPRRCVTDLAELSGDEREDLADVYLECLRRLDRMYNLPLPYISAWHQAPVRALGRDGGWLRCEMFSVQRPEGKLKYLAGSESAMGVFVNDAAPEQVAERLRQVGNA